jgi:UrcA family protein
MINRIFAAAAAGAVLISTPVLAGDDGAPKVTVEYDDLDLTSEKGQAALERRVRAAVNQACEADNPTTGSRVMSVSKSRCLAAAKQSAKSQVAAIIEDAKRGG